jgi:hypothetical protein
MGCDHEPARQTNIDFDRELSELPPPLRWRDYMMRIEAVIFAASRRVMRETLAALVGNDCNLDRPHELVSVAGGFQHPNGPTSPVPSRRIAREGSGPPILKIGGSPFKAEPINIKRPLACAHYSVAYLRLAERKSHSRQKRGPGGSRRWIRGQAEHNLRYTGYSHQSALCRLRGSADPYQAAELVHKGPAHMAGKVK